MTNANVAGSPVRVGAERSLLALMARAMEARLTVFTDADRLVVRGPRGTDPTLVAGLLAYKPVLLEILRNPIRDADQDSFEERAGIAEYEGGLTRTAAELLARTEIWCSSFPDE